MQSDVDNVVSYAIIYGIYARRHSSLNFVAKISDGKLPDCAGGFHE